MTIIIKTKFRGAGESGPMRSHARVEKSATGQRRIDIVVLLTDSKDYDLTATLQDMINIPVYGTGYER